MTTFQHARVLQFLRRASWASCTDCTTHTPTPCTNLLPPQFAVPALFLCRTLVLAAFGLRLLPLPDIIRAVLKYRTEVTMSLLPFEHVRGLYGVPAWGRVLKAAFIALDVVQCRSRISACVQISAQKNA